MEKGRSNKQPDKTNAQTGGQMAGKKPVILVAVATQPAKPAARRTLWRPDNSV